MSHEKKRNVEIHTVTVTTSPIELWHLPAETSSFAPSVFHFMLSLKRLSWDLSFLAWWMGMGGGGANEKVVYQVYVLGQSFLESELCTCCFVSWFIKSAESQERQQDTQWGFLDENTISQALVLSSSCCWAQNHHIQLQCESRSWGEMILDGFPYD